MRGLAEVDQHLRHQVRGDRFSGPGFPGNDEPLVLGFVYHGVVSLVGHREDVCRQVVLTSVAVLRHHPGTDHFCAALLGSYLNPTTAQGRIGLIEGRAL